MTDVAPTAADETRERLLDAAAEVFAERGAEGSLDEIAKRAGVGPGTLYRHFPTRDDLIDALMRDWTERVAADSVAAVEADVSARETLERWFADLIRHMTLHRGAAAKLSAAMDDPSSPIYRKCQMLGEANDRVITHLIETHALRDGVDVPGHSLRLVVMEGVPWPRPTVLHAARKLANGGSAYDDRTVRARLAQAFGRLIRRADDRGTFVLLSGATPSRLLTAFPPGVEIRRVTLDVAVDEVRRRLSSPAPLRQGAPILSPELR